MRVKMCDRCGRTFKSEEADLVLHEKQPEKKNKCGSVSIHVIDLCPRCCDQIRRWIDKAVEQRTGEAEGSNGADTDP